jgi:hypothetical protein
LDDLKSQERAALVTYHLSIGRTYTTYEVADLVGLTRQGAWAMLTTISRVVPIYCDSEGKWSLLSTAS